MMKQGEHLYSGKANNLARTMKQGEHLYSGKAKSLFNTDSPHQLIMQFRDELTAFDGKKKAQCPGKGIYNNKINAFLMSHLADKGIKVHLIEQLDDRRSLIDRLAMMKLEFIVRNQAAGSICTRLGLTKGKKFSRPVTEICLKSDELGDPLINDSHIELLGEPLGLVDKAREITLGVNSHLIRLFSEADIELVDFKLEFGLNQDNQLCLGDEISPDSCRLWDKSSRDSLDKDLFRFDLGDLLSGYKLVAERLGIQ